MEVPRIFELGTATLKHHQAKNQTLPRNQTASNITKSFALKANTATNHTTSHHYSRTSDYDEPLARRSSSHHSRHDELVPRRHYSDYDGQLVRRHSSHSSEHSRGSPHRDRSEHRHHHHHHRDEREISPLDKATGLMCLPVTTIFRETYELWDEFLYGVGKVYYKIFR